jgi:glycosyltransferase involved in cell wall biosynthesis
MPRFSIVTPTFNQGATIRQTIESVLSQDFRDLEYWVFDAGSRDETLKVLRDYEGDPRFHWVSEPDKGQSDAINKGLARATGDLFNWLNSDDYLAPGALGKLASVWEQDRSLHIVSARTDEFRGDPPVVFNQTRLQLRDSAEASITVGVYCQPSTYWRTDIFRDLGGVDPDLHCVMDWNLWVRYLALHGQAKVKVIPDLAAYFRHHAEAKTTAQGARFYEEAAIVFQNLHLTLDAPPPFLIHEAQRDPHWKCNLFRLGPDFDRELYLGKYADRMVRTWRRRDAVKAKRWLKVALHYKPWLDAWRLKMWLRLLFQ